MQDLKQLIQQIFNNSSIAPESLAPTGSALESSKMRFSIHIFKKAWGGLLIFLGYLLSPLCWWNDLIINLPIAYGVGYLCSLVAKDWFLAGAIAGYWLSNVVGILLMQFGVIEIAQDPAQKRRFSLKKELISGAITSTGYTVLILVLLKFGILDTPFTSETFAKISHGSFLAHINGPQS